MQEACVAREGRGGDGDRTCTTPTDHEIPHHEWMIAPGSHAATQGKGGLSEAGLQGPQVYLIFFRS